MKYPEMLYVIEEPKFDYTYPGIKHLVGKESLADAVPDNGHENVVAVYQLVSVGNYKKTVTRTALVEEVKP